MQAFAIGIGLLCVGDPAEVAAAPQQVQGAVKAVQQAAKTASSTAKMLSSGTMEALRDAVQNTVEMLDTTVRMTLSINEAEANSGSNAPPLPCLDLDQASLAQNELQQIFELASWDKWALETDQSMEFAISESIDGASEYRLELRKHAIDGKLVAQARSQAIKAGQELVLLKLTLAATQKDLARLQALRATFKGEIAQAEEAKQGFYDRMMMIRTNVILGLQKAIWAYKFFALKDSSVTLNPLKSIADLKADAQLIMQEVTSWKESSASDFARKYSQDRIWIYFLTMSNSLHSRSHLRLVSIFRLWAHNGHISTEDQLMHLHTYADPHRRNSVPVSNFGSLCRRLALPRRRPTRLPHRRKGQVLPRRQRLRSSRHLDVRRV
jgi:hypothetical protein